MYITSLIQTNEANLWERLTVGKGGLESQHSSQKLAMEGALQLD